jgi:serine/threonine/tyrosine-interacting protein
MWRYGLSCIEANKYVQMKRFCICPNDGFMAQLREFEPILKALHTVPNICNTQAANRGEKRAAEGEPSDLAGDQDVEMEN